MKCRHCQAEIPDASAFCNVCGGPQSAGHAPYPTANGPTPVVPEETLWEGRYSAKAAALSWLLWLFWVALLAVAATTFLAGKGTQVQLGLLLSALLPGLLLGARVLYRKLTMRYRLTNHRFFRERGLLSRSIDEVELIRVDDVTTVQDMVQRIFGVGRVVILSTDATDPRLLIDGISDPVGLKEKIRTQVRARRNRTTFLETL